MAIDLNIALGEEEDEHEPPMHEGLQAGHHFDLNLIPEDEHVAAFNEPQLHEEVLQDGHQFAGEDEHEPPLHEEVHQAGHHFDLNMNPEDEHDVDVAHGEEEHEADVVHGEEDLHESDESDDEVEYQGGVFQNMEEEMQAMHEALDNLQVDQGARRWGRRWGLGSSAGGRVDWVANAGD